MSEASFESGRVHREKLMADLRTVVADGEAILRDTASHSGEKVNELRTRIEERLGRARIHLENLEQAFMEKSRYAVEATDDFVNEQPWKAVGIAALSGLVVGILIGRR